MNYEALTPMIDEIASRRRALIPARPGDGSHTAAALAAQRIAGGPVLYVQSRTAAELRLPELRNADVTNVELASGTPAPPVGSDMVLIAAHLLPAWEQSLMAADFKGLIIDSHLVAANGTRRNRTLRRLLEEMILPADGVAYITCPVPVTPAGYIRLQALIGIDQPAAF